MSNCLQKLLRINFSKIYNKIKEFPIFENDLNRMLEILNTYRSFFYRFLLISYLLSVFQVPVFELAHFFSHAFQMSPTHAELHSYGTHHVHDHNHGILAFLDDSTSESEDHSNKTQDLELKKKVEITTSFFANSLTSFQLHSNTFGYLKKLSSLYQIPVAPPPQFC